MPVSSFDTCILMSILIVFKIEATNAATQFATTQFATVFRPVSDLQSIYVM